MEWCIQSLFDECLVFEPDSLSNIITEKCSNLSLNYCNNDNENKLINEELYVCYFLIFFLFIFLD